MSKIYINVEMAPGTSIEEACTDAVYFSRTHDMNIKFNFNGCLILCRPGSESADLVDMYRYWCKAGTNKAIGDN